VKHLKFTPLDTLFFRDGSPFSAGETGQMEVRGVFPPSPTTVVGALRAAFARELGWQGEAWGPNITAKLGDGDDLGSLSFSGPYLLRGGKPLFPAPLHLLRAVQREKGKEERKVLTFLEPGEKLTTDLGPVRLPEPKDKKTKGFKPLEDAYLTLEGMAKALSGETPELETIVRSNDLWRSEARVGIHRDDASRTTKEDALYQTVHVRLHHGVSLAMGISGYDGNLPELATLGGESRMVGLEQAAFALPKAPLLTGNRYTVTLITPGCFKDDGWRVPGGSLPGLPGTVTSACVGKPVMIGGWDSEGRRPKELVPHLPPGSTWFMEADDVQAALAMHGKHIGERPAWGYGQILIGVWG
jgi:CRISPR-associated protein Cmr3